MNLLIKIIKNNISLNSKIRRYTINSGYVSFSKDIFFHNKEDHFIASFNNDSIEFQINESNTKKFPYIWLRDHCKCYKCFNARTEELEFDLSEISLDIKPISIKNFNNNFFEITWHDGHKSEYSLNYLKSRAFEMEIKKREFLNPVLWNKEILLNQFNGLETIELQKYLDEKKWTKKAFEAILKYGAVLIENVPANSKEILKISQHIGPIIKSIDNRNSDENNNTDAVIVSDSLDISDRAYTNLSLKGHNDNIYIKNSAGIEIFHVIQPAIKGGETQLIDGFYCAQFLKKEFPEDFEILTKTKVEFEELKTKNSHRLSCIDNVINLNEISGQLAQIRYNPIYNIKVSHMNHENIYKFYKAMQNFTRILQDPKNAVFIGLKSNQALIFDNHRLLHGRSAFIGKNRKLISAYISRDDWLLTCSKFSLI